MNRHEITFPLHRQDLKRLVHTFKALAEETRIEILVLLGSGERSVGELVVALGAPQSTVSRHLSVLRAADLVATRRAGTSVHYRVAGAHIRELVHEALSHAQHERLGLPDHDVASDVRMRARTAELSEGQR
jgi:DNA-binding transcriptional ArsR family regulator